MIHYMLDCMWATHWTDDECLKLTIIMNRHQEESAAWRHELVSQLGFDKAMDIMLRWAWMRVQKKINYLIFDFNCKLERRMCLLDSKLKYYFDEIVMEHNFMMFKQHLYDQYIQNTKGAARG